MRQDMMSTYKELMNVKNPVTGLPIYFEYSSKYRRVLVVRDGASWILKVSYHGDARHLKAWSKTYGVKEDVFGWANVQIENRNIIMSPSFTVKEAIGKIIINRP